MNEVDQNNEVDQEVDQNVFVSEELGMLFFHEHLAGADDCSRCALNGVRDECPRAPCCRCEREDDRFGFFSMFEGEEFEEEEGA